MIVHEVFSGTSKEEQMLKYYQLISIWEDCENGEKNSNICQTEYRQEG